MQLDGIGAIANPDEGHGIQHFPAGFDFLARVIAWFDGYLKSA